MQDFFDRAKRLKVQNTEAEAEKTASVLAHTKRNQESEVKRQNQVQILFERFSGWVSQEKDSKNLHEGCSAAIVVIQMRDDFEIYILSELFSKKLQELEYEIAAVAKIEFYNELSEWLDFEKDIAAARFGNSLLETFAYIQTNKLKIVSETQIEEYWD